MQTPSLDQIAPELYDGMSPPASFAETCYDYKQMMDVLGIEDDLEFWERYRNGEILPGVALPTNVPFLCWDRGIVDKWLELGRPVDPAFWAHRMLVLTRLVDCVRATLSQFPPTKSESN